MEPTFPVTLVSEAFRKHLDPNGPVPLRAMAARGLVPMPPAELAKVAFLLLCDPDANVAAAAKATLAGLPEQILVPLLSAPLPTPVLDYFARAFATKAGYVEKLALNPAVHDETFAFLAMVAKEHELEIIADNQQRLLRYPTIIEKLYFNKETRMSTVDRVIDFAVRNGITIDSIPAFKEAAEALGVMKAEKGVAPTTPIEAAFPVAEEAAVGGAPGVVYLTAEDTRSLFEDEEAAESEEKAASGGEMKSGQVAKALLNMTVSQKIRWAQLGNKEVRSRLVRDSNRLVAIAAIKSPRMTTEEVVMHAANKTLDDDVIRYIARNREWTKSYTVRYNLVQNPKTPLPAALTYLQTLQADHLKNLAKSKNISNVVQAAARKKVLMREKHGS